MNDFQLYNPVRICFGASAFENIPEVLSPYRNILFLYGGNSIKASGLYDRLLEYLKDKNIQEFGNIKPNPDYETCMECVGRMKNGPVDLILAVGGGSVIDAGKFISAALKYGGEDPWDMLAKGVPVQETVPVATVPTIAATGSEMNCNSVISRMSTKEKLSFSDPKLFPVVSFLNPEVTFTLPARQTANGIIDSFAHVMEQYIAVNEDTDLQDRFAEGLLKTIIKHGRILQTDPLNYASRSSLMWASTMALNGIFSAGTNGDWASHMIGHELTSLYGIDHGLSLGIVMPGLLKVLKDQKRQRLLLLAKNVWDLDGGPEDTIIDKAIEMTKGFFEEVASVELTLKNFNVPSDAENIIAERFDSRCWSLGEHQNINGDMVRIILRQ